MKQDLPNNESSVTIISSGAPGWKERWRELLQYRELLWVLTLRDIKVRYKQTILGAAWAVIQPLAAMVVFSVFFGRLAGIPSDGYPYPVFVYSALLPWTLFANGVSTASQSMLGAVNMIQKVYFPRLHIPLASIGALIIDYLVASIVLFVLMAIYGIPVTLNLLALPVLTLGVVLTTLGVGILLAALNVTYRDFRYVVPFMVQIWLFLTPVVYGKSLVPEQWQWVLFLNPMAGIVDGFRAAYLGQPFDLPMIGISMLTATCLFAVGIAVFESTESRFADVI